MIVIIIYVVMHLSVSPPHPPPLWINIFYRGFDNEYCPNPGDIDIFWPKAHYSTSIQSLPLHFILAGKNIESKHRVGLTVTCIRWRPFKIVFMLVKSLC